MEFATSLQLLHGVSNIYGTFPLSTALKKSWFSLIMPIVTSVLIISIFRMINVQVENVLFKMADEHIFVFNVESYNWMSCGIIVSCSILQITKRVCIIKLYNVFNEIDDELKMIGCNVNNITQMNHVNIWLLVIHVYHLLAVVSYVWIPQSFAFLYIVLYRINIMNICMITLQMIVYSQALVKRCRIISELIANRNERLEKLIIPHIGKIQLKMLISNKLTSICSISKMISEGINLLNDIYGGQAVLIIVENMLHFMIIFYRIYIMTTEHGVNEETAAPIFLNVIGIIRITLTTVLMLIAANNLTKTVKETMSSLTKYGVKCEDEPNKKLIYFTSLATLRQNHELTAWGFCKLNNGTLFTIMMNIISLLVVIIQFDIATGKK